MNVELHRQIRAGATARAFPTLGGQQPGRRFQTAFQRNARPFAKGSTLILEGDACSHVLCVIDGWLAQSKSLVDGQCQIIDFVLSGDIVDPVSGDGMTSHVTIEALTDGWLTTIPCSSFETTVNEWPEFRQLVHRLRAVEHACRAERMLRLGKGTAEMRIAYALLEFCARLDPGCDDAASAFHIPLTQQMLGDFVGLSAVHVCRTMRRMARNGILETTNHMDIRIHDLRALARLAAVDHETLRQKILPRTFDA